MCYDSEHTKLGQGKTIAHYVLSTGNLGTSFFRTTMFIIFIMKNYSSDDSGPRVKIAVKYIRKKIISRKRRYTITAKSSERSFEALRGCSQ